MNDSRVLTAEMSFGSIFRWITDVRVVLILTFVALIYLLVGHHAIWIFGLSYAYHAINLQVFLFRQDNLERFITHSILFRSIAFLILGVLLMPYLDTPVNWYALVPLLAGLVLHTAAVRALGLRRTYYAAELGAASHSHIGSFPYNWLRHPMEIGAGLQFLGLYLLFPESTREVQLLILGHLFLTGVTAVVEHFDLHFDGWFFRAMVGRFSDDSVRATIDELRDWSLSHFRTHLHRECSMHRYVKTLPAEAIAKIDRVRYASDVMEKIQSAFPQSKVVPLPMTDEIYISRYNYDRGGDQGLFDKHYDGNLRLMPGASVVRSLLYLSSDDHLEVEFGTSQKKAVMKTYDYGLLDFHKELHWVNGFYDPQTPPRILLKCNYYVDHTQVAPYRWLGIWMNVAVFFVVKQAMEYSKSPKTVLQGAIGILCNVMRRLNNISPAAPIVLVLAVVALSVKVVAMQLGNLF